MKWIIAVLVLCGIAGVIAGITGVQQIHFSNAGFSVIHHTALSRVSALGLGILSLVAAFGCKKRKNYGWHLVNVLMWVSLLWAIFRAIYLGVTLHMDWLATALGAVGEAVKIGIWAWVIFHFWAGQRKQFNIPNQSSEPTLATDTIPERQEPRVG